MTEISSPETKAKLALSLDLPVHPPTEAELNLITKINATWSRGYALAELKASLQIAIEVELATIPIYLYACY
ncbi:MAG TPA: hypothetical protein VMJ31_12230, partial [Methylocystis sp.]|nr:hypothetical protein [Methylocystis sp.]